MTLRRPGRTRGGDVRRDPTHVREPRPRHARRRGMRTRDRRAPARARRAVPAAYV